MTKTIVITSGKGGVGKTNISVNIALELSNRKYRTCLFDADFGLANVDILLGLQPEMTLDDVIFGDKDLEDIILHADAGIDIIPGSSGTEQLANLTADKIDKLVSAFSRLAGYDYFLIDTASGISRGVISFCLAGTETIIVITSEATSLIDAYALVKVMAANGYQGTVKVLVNKCPDVPTSKNTYIRFKKAVDNYLNIKVALAGIVLYDPNIEEALKHQEPLLSRFPNSVASQCIQSMVSILLSNESLDEATGDFSTFWKRYFDFSSETLSIPDKPQERGEAKEPTSSDETDEPPPSHAPAVNTLKAEPADTERLLPSLASKAIPEDITEPPPQPDITESANNDSTTRLQDEQASEAEIKETPSPSPGNDTPTAILRPTPEMTNLASPLPILAKSLELKGKGTLSQSELMEIFTCDPALMLRVLRMSAFSQQQRGRRPANIRQILQEVGPDLLSSLLTQTALQSALYDLPTTDTDLLNQFWFHSYKTALIAQQIATTIKYPYPDEAYIAGLIHDTGRLALQTDSPQLYKQSPDSADEEKRLVEAERKAFGVDHAEFGATTLRDWHLSSFISDAVQYHTASSAAVETAFDLVKIVYLASRSTQVTDNKNEPALELGLSLLQLSPAQLQNCVSQSEEKLTQTAAYFGLALHSETDTNTTQEALVNFRKQAVDYSLLQGIFPPPAPTGDLSQIIARIHQSLYLLFNIQQAICLLPDEQFSCLQAVGYPNCWGEEIISEIKLSFESSNSTILEAFSTSTVQFITRQESTENFSLGDKQLVSYFDAQGLVCIPMVEGGESAGVIIFGLQQGGQAETEKLQNRLEQFGTQSARNILALKQITDLRKTKQQPSTAKMLDIQKDLFG
ncbi:MAG: hypothetical protein COA36_12745 [Desulfotalea sp.]|nr:MAG: hypothetical protein COA36_12745 [Desulfotalea sp.]